MTDMRDPKKVLEFAGDDTVAVMNRDKVAGYFTSAKSVEENVIRYVSNDDLMKSVNKIKEDYADALDYLKDK